MVTLGGAISLRAEFYGLPIFDQMHSLEAGLSSGITSKFTMSHSLDTSCVFQKKTKVPFFRAHWFNDIKGYALGTSIF